MSVAGQVLLGQELIQIKKDMGFQLGNNQHGRIGHNVQSSKTWPQLVEEKLGISYKTADRMIDCFEAAKARIKKIGAQGTLPAGSQKLTLLFTARPASMSEADREMLAKVVDKLVDGDTQKDLLQELKVVKCHVPLPGGDTSAHRKEKPVIPMAQLAFAFFSPVATGLRELRSDPSHEAYLHSLDIISSEEDAITLTSLRVDLEAELAAVKAALAVKTKA